MIKGRRTKFPAMRQFKNWDNTLSTSPHLSRANGRQPQDRVSNSLCDEVTVPKEEIQPEFKDNKDWYFGSGCGG